MGHRQSKIINSRLTEEPLSNAQPATAEPVAKISIAVTNSSNSNNNSPINSKSPTLSKNTTVRAAFINTAEAKQWNPNNPASWEPEMREYHTLENSDYVLPNDVNEQDRLEMQHYVMRAAFKGDIVCPAAKTLLKETGGKVLDVGCAKGFWLKCVKRENPLAEYHGVDISRALVEGTSPDGITLQFGNVLETLPFEDSTFDFVHQRFLVGGMPRAKFPDAIRELVRVTKPGGWIELIEGDGIVYNAGPYSQTLATALFDAFHRRGLDGYTATNLPWYVKQVGEHVQNQEFQTVHLSLNWGSKMGILFGADAKALYLGMEDFLHKAMGITRDEYRELVQNCYSEWTFHKSFMQSRALYFQPRIGSNMSSLNARSASRNRRASPTERRFDDDNGYDQSQPVFGKSTSRQGDNKTDQQQQPNGYAPDPYYNNYNYNGNNYDNNGNNYDMYTNTNLPAPPAYPPPSHAPNTRRPIDWDQDQEQESAYESGAKSEYDDYYEDSLEGKKQKNPNRFSRYLCCCVPKDKKRRYICLGITFVVLVILGVLAYLFFPQYPQVKVFSAFISSPFSFSVANEADPDYNTLNIKLNLTLALETTNPNRYDFKVESISLIADLDVNTTYVGNALLTTPLTGFNSLLDLVPLPANRSSSYTGSLSPQIGTANYGAITFPAQNSVNYSMTFEFSYSPDPKLGLLLDPGVNEIASACGITDRNSKQRPLQFSYTATTVISILKNLGFNPALNGIMHFTCPFTEAQIASVVTAVENGESIITAAQSVFGSS
ncbi:hypothetical protein HK100_012875 [Physocladia obscura]|uniref:Methyltransferase domain-containing protein n=1 Tax=Physocladia obscura TaxID=109957 RepID=A0AAD5TAJ8_9FUNG|nr:hypothetical protein HK100_012875 [Physocladia obscura]